MFDSFNLDSFIFKKIGRDPFVMFGFVCFVGYGYTSLFPRSRTDELVYLFGGNCSTPKAPHFRIDDLISSNLGSLVANFLVFKQKDRQ